MRMNEKSRALGRGGRYRLGGGRCFSLAPLTTAVGVCSSKARKFTPVEAQREGALTPIGFTAELTARIMLSLCSLP